MKKVWTFLKKFWWIILAVISFVAGLLLPKRKEQGQDIEQLKKQADELEKQQNELEREAKEIENKKYFNDGDDAADYINTIRKRK